MMFRLLILLSIALAPTLLVGCDSRSQREQEIIERALQQQANALIGDELAQYLLHPRRHLLQQRLTRGLRRHVEEIAA